MTEIPRYVGARHPVFNPEKELDIKVVGQLLYFENGSINYGGLSKQEPAKYTTSKHIVVAGKKKIFHPGVVLSRIDRLITKENFNKKLDLLVEQEGTIGFLVDLWEDLTSSEQYTIGGVFGQEGHDLCGISFKATPAIEIVFSGGIIAHPALFDDPKNHGVKGRALAFDTYSFGLAQEPIDEIIRKK